jgi:hypothetical protein
VKSVDTRENCIKILSVLHSEAQCIQSMFTKIPPETDAVHREVLCGPAIVVPSDPMANAGVVPGIEKAGITGDGTKTRDSLSVNCRIQGHPPLDERKGEGFSVRSAPETAGCSKTMSRTSIQKTETGSPAFSLSSPYCHLEKAPAF